MAPFFIVGSARSGTTLLRMLFNAHPQVAVPPESRFVVELWDGSEEIDVESFLGKLQGHKRFQMWDLPIEGVVQKLPGRARVPYSEAVTAAFEAYAEAHGKQRWGDKTPRYIEHLSLLSELFPQARFIHMIRDGRNVALSYGDVPFGPKTVAGAARLWARRVGNGCRIGRSLGPARYKEIRYEDLTADLETAAHSLCEFVDVDFESVMLDYTERARSDVLPRAARYNPHVSEKPVVQTRSWEQQMNDDEVEIFEAVAGDLLAELGYERRHPAPGRRARLVAAVSGLGLPIARLKASRPS